MYTFGGGLDGSEVYIKVQALNLTVLNSTYPATSFNIGDLAKVDTGENEFLTSILTPWTAPKYKNPPGLYVVRDNGSGNQWFLFQNQTITSLKTLIFDANDDWAGFYSANPTIKANSLINYLGKRYINKTGSLSSTIPSLDQVNWGSYIDIAPRVTTPYEEGRISYSEALKTHCFHTGYTDVIVGAGREIQGEFYNNTGSLISNGDPVAVTGTFTDVIVSGVTKSLPNIIPSDSSTVLNALGFAGLAAMDIPAGEPGIVTSKGLVKGVNTQALVQGFIYLDSDGWFTQTRPLYPEQRILVGAVSKTGVTDGEIFVNSQRIKRTDLGKSYSFTSQGVGAGLYYDAGFYAWATTSITLTQASLTQTHGTVGRAYAAHAGIVPSAPGTVDTGQVGLRVTGIKDTETGAQLAAQTAIITEDITTLTANIMAETSGKFSGQITYELYVVSGTPTAYSLSFNYGYSKYDDFGNKDFTLTGFETVWRGAANDTAFNIRVLHHKATDWTYSGSGFLPGDGAIAERLTDQDLSGNVLNGKQGAWKRVNLDTFIEGSNAEGIILEITTGQNNTIQTMDLHIAASSEEL